MVARGDLDVVIELLDARLPGSSSNPLLASLTTGRPSLKVLNKQDLADPAQVATPVSAIARRRGFTNPTRFGQLVRERTGRTPTQYRRDAFG